MWFSYIVSVEAHTEAKSVKVESWKILQQPGMRMVAMWVRKSSSRCKDDRFHHLHTDLSHDWLVKSCKCKRWWETSFIFTVCCGKVWRIQCGCGQQPCEAFQGKIRQGGGGHCCNGCHGTCTLCVHTDCWELSDRWGSSLIWAMIDHSGSGGVHRRSLVSLAKWVTDTK